MRRRPADPRSASLEGVQAADSRERAPLAPRSVRPTPIRVGVRDHARYPARVKRPHVLGVDEGPFAKGQLEPVPLVAALCEGADLVEAVAQSSFPVDGDGATEFLARWLGSLRFRPSLQGIALGGITLAGLALVDVRALSDALETPVLVVTRRPPDNARLRQALDAAGLSSRFSIAARSPEALPTGDGIWLAHAGIDRDGALALLRASSGKAKLPEALRIAHLVATALVRGESHGRS